MLWKVEIRPSETEPNRAGRALAHEAADLGIVYGHSRRRRARLSDPGQSVARRRRANRVAQLLADPIVERYRIAPPTDALWNAPSGRRSQKRRPRAA
ncbi:MAG: hypothetical protein QM811_28460 [Pirellulales bacterium]